MTSALMSSQITVERKIMTSALMSSQITVERKNELRIKDLKTGNFFYESSPDHPNIYHYNHGDVLHWSCKRNSSSDDALSWNIISDNTLELTPPFCGYKNVKSIRYQAILSSVDNEKTVICLSRDPDNARKRIVVNLQIDEKRTSDNCAHLTQLVCPGYWKYLGYDPIDIYVNSEKQEPKRNHFSSTEEYLYYYKHNEKLEITCTFKNKNKVTWKYLFLCGNMLSDSHIKCGVGFCNQTTTINLEASNNNSVVYCYTSEEAENFNPVASLRFIATTSENGIDEKSNEDRLKNTIDSKLESKVFNVLLALAIILVTLAIILLTYSIHLKYNCTRKKAKANKNEPNSEYIDLDWNKNLDESNLYVNSMNEETSVTRRDVTADLELLYSQPIQRSIRRKDPDQQQEIERPEEFFEDNIYYDNYNNDQPEYYNNFDNIYLNSPANKPS